MRTAEAARAPAVFSQVCARRRLAPFVCATVRGAHRPPEVGFAGTSRWTPASSGMSSGRHVKRYEAGGGLQGCKRQEEQRLGGRGVRDERHRSTQQMACNAEGPALQGPDLGWSDSTPKRQATSHKRPATGSKLGRARAGVVEHRRALVSEGGCGRAHSSEGGP